MMQFVMGRWASQAVGAAARLGVADHLAAGAKTAEDVARPSLTHVAAGTKQALEATGLSGRVEVVAGDFFEQVPSGGDVYLPKHILHDWNDEKCVVILKNIRKAMKPTAKIVVVEFALPDGPTPSPSAPHGPQHARDARWPGTHRGSVCSALRQGRLEALALHPHQEPDGHRRSCHRVGAPRFSAGSSGAPAARDPTCCKQLCL
jgi:hypothetical protein